MLFYSISAISFTCKVHKGSIHVSHPLKNRTSYTDYHITTKNLLTNEILDNKECQNTDGNLLCKWIYKIKAHDFKKSFEIELLKKNETISKKTFTKILDCFSHPLQSISLVGSELFLKTSTLYDVMTGVRRHFNYSFNGLHKDYIASRCSNGKCSINLNRIPKPGEKVCLTLDFDNIFKTKCVSPVKPVPGKQQKKNNISIPIISAILATAFIIMVVIVIIIKKRWPNTQGRTSRTGSNDSLSRRPSETPSIDEDNLIPPRYHTPDIRVSRTGPNDILPRQEVKTIDDDDIITPQNQYESIKDGSIENDAPYHVPRLISPVVTDKTIEHDEKSM